MTCPLLLTPVQRSIHSVALGSTGETVRECDLTPRNVTSCTWLELKVIRCASIKLLEIVLGMKQSATYLSVLISSNLLRNHRRYALTTHSLQSCYVTIEIGVSGIHKPYMCDRWFTLSLWNFKESGLITAALVRFGARTQALNARGLLCKVYSSPLTPKLYTSARWFTCSLRKYPASSEFRSERNLLTFGVSGCLTPVDTVWDPHNEEL